jgi:lipoate-protein ligase A
VSGFVTELHDYDELRAETSPLMVVVQVEQPVLVLGSSQSLDILDTARLGATPTRRRRGGGGLVLLQPGDLWIDWWIPASDERWTDDVHVGSQRAGGWWKAALAPLIKGEISIHDGALEGDRAYRLVCFAGAGPGELFVDGRKVVGVTQWRVREGIFLSSALLSHNSDVILSYLREVPDGLAAALNHHTTASLGIRNTDALIDSLRDASSPSTYRSIKLAL